MEMLHSVYNDPVNVWNPFNLNPEGTDLLPKLIKHILVVTALWALQIANIFLYCAWPFIMLCRLPFVLILLIFFSSTKLVFLKRSWNLLIFLWTLDEECLRESDDTGRTWDQLTLDEKHVYREIDLQLLHAIKLLESLIEGLVQFSIQLMNTVLNKQVSSAFLASSIATILDLASSIWRYFYHFVLKGKFTHLPTIISHYHLSLPSLTTISHYHLSVSSLTIIAQYHRSLSSLTIISHYHLSLSSLTTISHYHRSLASLTIIAHYHLSLLFVLEGKKLSDLQDVTEDHIELIEAKFKTLSQKKLSSQDLAISGVFDDAVVSFKSAFRNRVAKPLGFGNAKVYYMEQKDLELQLRTAQLQQEKQEKEELQLRLKQLEQDKQEKEELQLRLTKLEQEKQEKEELEVINLEQD